MATKNIGDDAFCESTKSDIIKSMGKKLTEHLAEKFITHQKLINEIRQKSLAVIMKVDKDVGEYKLTELTKKLERAKNG